MELPTTSPGGGPPAAEPTARRPAASPPLPDSGPSGRGPSPTATPVAALRLPGAAPQAVPPPPGLADAILAGRDLIVEAQPGPIKTASCAAGALQCLDVGTMACQALVLVPTRESAQHFKAVMLALGALLGVRCHACMGSTSTDGLRLREGQHVVIGTPHRVVDMTRRGYLQLGGLRLLLMDEADELLARSFEKDICRLVDLLPSGVQVGVFAAVLSAEVIELAGRFVHEPFTLTLPKATSQGQGASEGTCSDSGPLFSRTSTCSSLVQDNEDPPPGEASGGEKPDECQQRGSHGGSPRRARPRAGVKEDQLLTLRGVQQFYVAVEREERKTRVLCDLFDALGSAVRSVVYCSSRQRAEDLGDFLSRRGILVLVSHSELGRRERGHVASEFRTGNPRTLVTTDLPKREETRNYVHQAPLVVNYDIPLEVGNYLSRVGRRVNESCMPQKAMAISLVTESDEEMVRDIQQHYKVLLEELPAEVARLLG